MTTFQPFEALEKLLGQSEPSTKALLPPNSRYRATEVASLATADGESIPYLRRRFVPAPERFATLSEYVVSRGERLDNLAAQFVGDPEQFWLLCDANRVLLPSELEADGRRLRVTYPEGIPAPTSNS